MQRVFLDILMPNHETAAQADKLATSVSPYAPETAYFANAKSLIGWAWKKPSCRLVWHTALSLPCPGTPGQRLRGSEIKGH